MEKAGSASDLYSLGILGYELMFGTTPHSSTSKKEYAAAIEANKLHIYKSKIPDGWSLESADFINKLIHVRPQRRLGYRGVADLKSHPWLQGVDWDGLA
jgi:serine/threonine protein kinase